MIISTSPKSGTTWMQFIVHLLRTNGTDVGFGEIGEVVPWIDHARELGQNLNDEQRSSREDGGRPLPFRAFKTHKVQLDAPWLQRRGTAARPLVPLYIAVLRDPMDAAWSFYNFGLATHNAAPGSVSQRYFFETSVLGRQFNAAAFAAHMVTLRDRAAASRALLVFYEDMKEDLPGHVAAVAEFLRHGVPGFDPTPEAVDLATQRASFAWMKAHATLFDEHFAWGKLVAPSLQPGPGQQQHELQLLHPPDKVVVGRVGDGGERLVPEVRQLLLRQWAEARPGGAANYAELRTRYGHRIRRGLPR